MRPNLEFWKKKEEKKCTYESHKTIVGKAWHFLAHEDTWLSFIADAIIIILVGKFLIYPAIGLALGTDYPVVAVVSPSMDHRGNEFDIWWQSHSSHYQKFNITKEQFLTFYLPNGFKKGDVLIIKSQEDYKTGDIIVYKVASRRDPLIHRVIATNPIQTKGDANQGQLQFERAISEEVIEGKAVLKIPYLGWVKVGLLQLIR